VFVRFINSPYNLWCGHQHGCTSQEMFYTWSAEPITAAAKWCPKCATTSGCRNCSARPEEAAGSTSSGVGRMPGGHANSLHETGHVCITAQGARNMKTGQHGLWKPLFAA